MADSNFNTSISDLVARCSSLIPSASAKSLFDISLCLKSIKQTENSTLESLFVSRINSLLSTATVLDKQYMSRAIANMLETTVISGVDLPSQNGHLYKLLQTNGINTSWVSPDLSEISETNVVPLADKILGYDGTNLVSSEDIPTLTIATISSSATLPATDTTGKLVYAVAEGTYHYFDGTAWNEISLATAALLFIISQFEDDAGTVSNLPMTTADYSFVNTSVLQGGSFSGDLAISYDGTRVFAGDPGANSVPNNSGYTSHGGLWVVNKQTDGNWVASANGSHTNVWSTSPKPMWGSYGIACSPDGNSAVAVSPAYINTGYTQQFLQLNVPAGDITKNSEIGDQGYTYMDYPISLAGGTYHAWYLQSPCVGDPTSNISYFSTAQPGFDKRNNTIYPPVDNIGLWSKGQLQSGKNPSSNWDLRNSVWVNNSTPNQYLGERGSACTHDGVTSVLLNRSNAMIFNNNSLVSTNSSSLNGNALSNIPTNFYSRWTIRSDANGKFYIFFGALGKILVLDNVTSQNWNNVTYSEITLPLTVLTTGNWGTLCGFDVSYDGNYIMVANSSNCNKILVMSNNNGVWEENTTIDLGGQVNRAVMSGDASTICATKSGELFIWETS